MIIVHDIRNDVYIGVVKEIKGGMVYYDCEGDGSLDGMGMPCFDGPKPKVGDQVVVIYVNGIGFVGRVFNVPPTSTDDDGNKPAEFESTAHIP